MIIYSIGSIGDDFGANWKWNFTNKISKRRKKKREKQRLKTCVRAELFRLTETRHRPTLARVSHRQEHRYAHDIMWMDCGFFHVCVRACVVRIGVNLNIRFTEQCDTNLMGYSSTELIFIFYPTINWHICLKQWRMDGMSVVPQRTAPVNWYESRIARSFTSVGSGAVCSNILCFLCGIILINNKNNNKTVNASASQSRSEKVNSEQSSRENRVTRKHGKWWFVWVQNNTFWRIYNYVPCLFANRVDSMSSFVALRSTMRHFFFRFFFLFCIVARVSQSHCIHTRSKYTHAQSHTLFSANKNGNFDSLVPPLIHCYSGSSSVLFWLVSLSTRNFGSLSPSFLTLLPTPVYFFLFSFFAVCFVTIATGASIISSYFFSTFLLLLLLVAFVRSIRATCIAMHTYTAHTHTHWLHLEKLREKT